MAQWGTTDDAANSVIWAAAQVNKTANTTNQTALFNNNTQGAFITNVTVGQYGASPDEIIAARDGASVKAPHAGWLLRTEGTGGRAGRVHNEVLVAMSTISTDAADDAKLPDYRLRITTQPQNASGNATNDDIVTFNVVARSTPTGAIISYKWQQYDGAAFIDITDVGAYSNSGTPTLSVLANTASTGEIYRVQISTAGAANVISANAVLTITT